jgi:hypothetical protein
MKKEEEKRKKKKKTKKKKKHMDTLMTANFLHFKTGWLL